jgi:hypothetical protein
MNWKLYGRKKSVGTWGNLYRYYSRTSREIFTVTLCQGTQWRLFTRRRCRVSRVWRAFLVEPLRGIVCSVRIGTRCKQWPHSCSVKEQWLQDVTVRMKCEPGNRHTLIKWGNVRCQHDKQVSCARVIYVAIRIQKTGRIFRQPLVAGLLTEAWIWKALIRPAR